MTKKIEKEWVTWCDIECVSANLYSKRVRHSGCLVFHWYG